MDVTHMQAAPDAAMDEEGRQQIKLLAHRMAGLLPDFAIEALSLDPNVKMIEPYSPMEDRPGVISYGLTSTGYDVRIGNNFRIFTNLKSGVVDPKNFDPKAFGVIEGVPDGEKVIIPPNSYLLGESVEFFRIPKDVTVICIGKSTYARCGIIVNVTPGEPAWHGRWTIEVSNSSPCPAIIYAGEGIMQCLFLRTAIPCRKNYADKKGKYQNDQSLQTAKVL